MSDEASLVVRARFVERCCSTRMGALTMMMQVRWMTRREPPHPRLRLSSVKNSRRKAIQIET